MKLLALFVSLLILAVPLSAQKRYYRGNTHTHCYPRSSDVKDSTYTAQKIIASYKSKGYDFLVFTDHLNYWNADSLSSPDLTVIGGSEAGLSAGYRGHFTAMNIKTNISGRGKTFQQLVDDIVADRGIPFLNHPRWSVIPVSAVQILNEMRTGLNHLEVYNSNTDSPTKYDTSVWDSVLTSGRIMYGVASDDSHREAYQGKAWICVYASSLEKDTLLQAIRTGDFYASNGIILETVYYSNEGVRVKSKNGTRIRFIGRRGAILDSLQRGEGFYRIRGDEGYVRVEIANDQNETAWTQPMMVGSFDIQKP